MYICWIQLSFHQLQAKSSLCISINNINALHATKARTDSVMRFFQRPQGDFVEYLLVWFCMMINFVAEITNYTVWCVIASFKCNPMLIHTGIWNHMIRGGGESQTKKTFYIILYYNIRTYRKIGLVHEKVCRFTILQSHPPVLFYTPEVPRCLFQIVYLPKPLLVYSWNSLLKCTYANIFSQDTHFNLIQGNDH